MNQERILAVHDISCVGRCSLTVALPIVSSVGIECSVLPTAVLSTHTGGFTGFTYRDLTEDIVPIEEHWKTLDLKFDAFYTGFLGSFEQIDLVMKLVDELSHEGTTVYVDPVMGDKGNLYSVFGPDFPAGMRRLCEKADVIIPNLTELSFMMGREYVEGPYTREYIDSVLEDAREFGVDRIIITGISFEEGMVGAVFLDYNTGEKGEVMRPEIPGYYHGTGDVFGSALVGACESGLSLSDAVEVAVDFTVGSITRTREAGTDIRYGVNFEGGLFDYISDVRARKN
ncbi:MAG: pyridoxamine kinase [Candidatus Methanomethylophilaceae archaeon]|nr:pyridoxamine kinase [Candidatus Methanomethylophilaceae archaeon]